MVVSSLSTSGREAFGEGRCRACSRSCRSPGRRSVAQSYPLGAREDVPARKMKDGQACGQVTLALAAVELVGHRPHGGARSDPDGHLSALRRGRAGRAEPPRPVRRHLYRYPRDGPAPTVSPIHERRGSDRVVLIAGRGAHQVSGKQWAAFRSILSERPTHGPHRRLRRFARSRRRSAARRDRPTALSPRSPDPGSAGGAGHGEPTRAAAQWPCP
jgi:hypothetical protein